MTMENHRFYIGDTWICFFSDSVRILPWEITIIHHHLGESFWFNFSKHRGQDPSFDAHVFQRGGFNHQLVIDCQHTNHENGILSNKNYSSSTAG